MPVRPAARRRAAATSSASALRVRCSDELGKAFAPAEVRFTTALPKTRSAKIVRRAVRATLLDEDPGDVSTLEDASALDAIRNAT